MTSAARQRCSVCHEGGHNRRTCELRDNEQELETQSSLLDWVVDQLMSLKRQVAELRAERSEDKAIIGAQQARITALERRREQLQNEVNRLRKLNKTLRYRHAAFARFSDDTRL